MAPLLSDGDIVIFESTVYPGATREVCIPILEKLSSLRCSFDDQDNDSEKSGVFYCGYSPERINPGDKSHTLENTIKIIAASNKFALDVIFRIYSSIVKAGIHTAESIEIAEAAKVIENTQRDLNIALMNELSKIFSLLKLDTGKILEAAGTKWNFLKFQPGLVGGHCIGVDPYYLTSRAQELGYIPEVILAGRRVNDSMGHHVAEKTLEIMLRRKLISGQAKILVLGLTFKEDCPDLRNSRVFDILNHFSSRCIKVHVYDPHICNLSSNLGLSESVELISDLDDRELYQAIVIAVGHRRFKELGEARIKRLGVSDAVIIDVKSIFSHQFSDYRL